MHTVENWKPLENKPWANSKVPLVKEKENLRHKPATSNPPSNRLSNASKLSENPPSQLLREKQKDLLIRLNSKEDNSLRKQRVQLERLWDSSK